MRCKDCPAYWKEEDYYNGVTNWSCFCEPEDSDKCGELVFKDGSRGCKRASSYIEKVMKQMIEKEGK